MKNIVAYLSSLSRLTQLIIITAVLLISYFVFQAQKNNSSHSQTFTTEQATKGDLVVSVTGSGSVKDINNVTVSTQATGVVTKIYVKDGDMVKAGQKLADLELDTSGRQNYLFALASYQSANNNLANAKSTLDSLNSAMWKAHETFMSDAVSRSLPAEDPTYIMQSSEWLAGEAKYKTQIEAIKQAQTSLSGSYLSYLESSPAIYAPISGRVSGFSLQQGTVINETTSSSGTSIATKIASIVTDAKPTITVTLTEVDITKVKPGDKATVTIDSQIDKTFPGSVISVDTVGMVSSGVTSYGVALRLDTDEPGLYPNMSASATIITQVKNGVLMIPSSAIKSNIGAPYVQIITNGKVSNTPVTTGLSSGTETEIVSGLSEGDTVVTSSSPPSNAPTTQSTQSIFSSFSRGGAGGARMITR